MSAEVVDFAGLDAQAVDAGASTEVESIDSGTNEVETQESEQTEQSSSDESTSAGDETERRESAKGQDTGKNKESGPALPKTITAALKTLARATLTIRISRALLSSLEIASSVGRHTTKSLAQSRQLARLRAFCRRLQGPMDSL